jgi:uncharacterized membrane protein YhaH (DUF805 family)
MNRALYLLTLSLVILLYLTLNFVSSKHGSISEGVLIFLCIPRLHDIGKSGWFVLIGIFIEVIGLVVGFSFFSLEGAKAVEGLAVIIIIGLLIWLGTIPGDPTPNRWGEPPAPGVQFWRGKRLKNE